MLIECPKIDQFYHLKCLSCKRQQSLDYTSTPNIFKDTLIKSEIKTIYTSGEFIQELKEMGVDIAESLEECEIIDVDLLASKTDQFSKIATLAAVRFLPVWLLKTLYSKNHDGQLAAAIVFTNNNQDLKGVVLSHQNILVNLKQMAEVLNAEGDDVVMASLPLYQAFGLTVTQFLPLIEGLPMVCHVDPQDSIGVSKAVAKYNATTLFGTSSLFKGYTDNEEVQPLMLKSLRVAVSGFEGLTEEVKTAFKLKFAKDIYEGYGTTETAPVASVNLPDVLDTSYWQVQLGTKLGTVGMPLPGASFKITDPVTFEELPTGENGMILIGGPQVMLGYLNNPEKTAEVLHEIDGARWFVSGDKGHLDEDGFLQITDQYQH